MFVDLQFGTRCFGTLLEARILRWFLGFFFYFFLGKICVPVCLK